MKRKFYIFCAMALCALLAILIYTCFELIMLKIYNIYLPSSSGAMLGNAITILLVGIFGGYLVGVPLIGVDTGAFWAQMQGGVDLFSDIGNGFIKSIVFGVAVTFIALYQGRQERGR